MTMRERFRAMFVPELQAAYRMRDDAQNAMDAALDRAAEAEHALKRERVYADFWCSECGRADRQVLELVRAIEYAEDLDTLRAAAKTILRGKSG